MCGLTLRTLVHVYSARWEEAATCFNDCAERPSVEAEVRLKIAGYYTKVARSDPARLEVRPLLFRDHLARSVSQIHVSGSAFFTSYARLSRNLFSCVVFACVRCRNKWDVPVIFSAKSFELSSRTKVRILLYIRS